MSKLPTCISLFYYQICARLSIFLEFNIFASLQGAIQGIFQIRWKFKKAHETQNTIRSHTDSILEVWYSSWKLWHQSLCSKNIWVPQWYPYYYETLLIHLYFSMDHIWMERTNVTSQLNVVPQWYPKNIFRKIYIVSFLTPYQSSV